MLRGAADNIYQPWIILAKILQHTRHGKARLTDRAFLFYVSFQLFSLVAGEGLEPPTSGL
jgi:hypothetical protein